MEVLFPFIKRRYDLATMSQKSGQLFSNFYWTVEKEEQECKLEERTVSDWIGQLAIQNMRTNC